MYLLDLLQYQIKICGRAAVKARIRPVGITKVFNKLITIRVRCALRVGCLFLRYEEEQMPLSRPLPPLRYGIPCRAHVLRDPHFEERKMDRGAEAGHGDQPWNWGDEEIREWAAEKQVECSAWLRLIRGEF
jgi:hypothetical protein